MHHSKQSIAQAVIRRANRETPADDVLREVLRSHRDMSPADAAEVSRIVFRHYRWMGWLRRERSLPAKLRVATALDTRFRTDPDSFPQAELRARAVPAWTSEEMDITDGWLRALQSPPVLWLRSRKGQGRELAKRLGLSEVGSIAQMPEALVYEGEHDLFQTPEFKSGQFEIQDIASQWVGRFCGPKPGETWWDACAGEGGKTLHLADLMENKGLIWASDRAGWRLERLKRRAARAGLFNIRTVVWDGGERPPTKARFDGVLLDAPCSGVGTWQRNPQARWTTTLKDVRELAVVQRRLLTNVAGSVKPGGKLVYAVCTLTKSETEDVVQAFSRVCPGFEPLELPGWKSTGGGLSTAANSPATRIAVVRPQDWRGNGMFVAAWRRKN